MINFGNMLDNQMGRADPTTQPDWLDPMTHLSWTDCKAQTGWVAR